MAKVDENMFNSATNSAELKSKEKNEEKYKTVSVYEIPLSWVNIVRNKTGIKSMAAYARQAILEKLERDGLI